MNVGFKEDVSSVLPASMAQGALPPEREAELRDAFDQFAIGGQLGFDESRGARRR